MFFLDCIIRLDIEAVKLQGYNGYHILVKGKQRDTVCWQTGINVNPKNSVLKELVSIALFQLARRIAKDLGKIPAYNFPLFDALVELKAPDEMRDNFEEFIQAFKNGLESKDSTRND